MRHATRFFLAASVALLVFMAQTSWAQQTTARTTELRTFEVVSVDGNKVVIKEATGAREITVPPDFKFTVDGKEVGVDELKPGMRGTATITTTTTSTPVFVTEVRNAQVVQSTGNSVTVRTPNGFRMFGPGDVQKRNAKIMRDGKEINFSEIRNGDNLTAVIITEAPPVVLTERQVRASLATPPPPAPTQTTPPPTTPPPTMTTPPPPPEPAAESKSLPKTATDRPLMGILGAVALAVATAMTIRRRRGAVR